MRYILLVLLAFVTTFASAQVQFLGSPTTTVRNRGNFVSDSLFYLPKRTKAPSDTGAIRYQISDSALYVWTGSAWRTAGTAGSAITGSGVAGYMPEFTTATNIDTTRLYHSNGRFAIGSTTTTNGVFNVYGGQSYMDSSLKIGNGELIVGSTSSASRKLYVTSNSDVARFEQTASDKNMVIELRHTNPNASGTIREEGINFLAPNTSTRGRITFYPSDTFNVRNYFAFFTPSGSGTNAERMRIANDGEILIGTTSDAGTYALQVAGAMYATGNLNFAGGDISISNISNNILAFATNNTERMRIQSDGRIGIGTSSSLVAQLTIREPAIAGAGAEVLRFVGNGSNDNYMRTYWVTNTGTTLAQMSVNGIVDMQFGTFTNMPLALYTNSVERMRIKSDGEVLIGTTTDAGAYALQVAGSIYATQDAYFYTNIRVGRGAGNVASNTLLGAGAMTSNTTGDRITVVGANAAQSNTTGALLTAIGYNALAANTTGNGSTAVGVNVLYKNTTGQDNTGIGSYWNDLPPLSENTTGSFNTGVGGGAIARATTATDNTGVGYRSLANLTTGGLNTALGAYAGASINANTANQTSTNSIYIGYDTRASANGNTNEIVIGHNGRGNGSNTITFGNSSTTDNYFTGSIRTSAPSGGSIKPWKIGEAATVSPTSPNRTIRVEIDGTVYYIHAKTTND